VLRLVGFWGPLRLIETERLDAALLDATLAGEPVDALAAALDACGVPFAFASGTDPRGYPRASATNRCSASPSTQRRCCV